MLELGRAGLDPCTPARDSTATLAELMKQVKSRPSSEMGPPPTLPRAPVVDHPPASLSIERDTWDQGRVSTCNCLAFVCGLVGHVALPLYHNLTLYEQCGTSAPSPFWATEQKIEH